MFQTFRRFTYGLLYMGLFYLVLACSSNPYKATNKLYKKEVRLLLADIKKPPRQWESDSMLQPLYQVSAINFNLRKPQYIILHHTAQNSCAQTLRTFTLSRTQVSAHYVICREGTVHHMLNDYLRAWHAGAGSWKGNTDVNSSSIGIELDNNGTEPFPETQMNALLSLLSRLTTTYSIPAQNILAHADIAPTRKNDPSVFFDWARLAAQGYGQWYGDTTGVTIPPHFNPWHSLRLIGYDVKDTTAALQAFKRHWMRLETNTITEADKKVMYLLEQQRR